MKTLNWPINYKNKKIYNHMKELDLSPSFNWDIRKEKVYTDSGEAKKYFGLHRDDNNELLAIHKNSYQSLPNKELTERAEGIRDIAGYRIAGYSTLNERRRVLAYLVNTDPSLNINGLPVKEYMVLVRSPNSY